MIGQIYVAIYISDGDVIATHSVSIIHAPLVDRTHVVNDHVCLVKCIEFYAQMVFILYNEHHLCINTNGLTDLI